MIFGKAEGFGNAKNSKELWIQMQNFKGTSNFYISFLIDGISIKQKKNRVDKVEWIEGRKIKLQA